MTTQSTRNLALKNVADLLTYFNSDSVNRAQLAWKHTGMEISLLGILITFRNQLVNSSNPGLHQKFKVLKDNFSKYLEEKSKGMHSSTTADLIFEISQIVHLQLIEAIPPVIDDLNSFNHPLKNELITCLNDHNFGEVGSILDKMSS